MQRKKLHTEINATYTHINVPKQAIVPQNKMDREYILLFKLSNKKNISIAIRSGITFVLSGNFLIHC